MAKKRKTGPKGFPITLQKPVWFTLLASISFQIATHHCEDRAPLEELYMLFAGTLQGSGIKLGDEKGGVKTIRIRAHQVSAMKDVLSFAYTLHSKNIYERVVGATWTGKQFQQQFTKLHLLDPVELMADLAR